MMAGYRAVKPIVTSQSGGPVMSKRIFSQLRQDADPGVDRASLARCLVLPHSRSDANAVVVGRVGSASARFTSNGRT